MSSFSSFLLRFPLYDFIIKYVMSVVIIVCRSVTDGSENKRPEQKPNRNAQKTDYLNAFDSNSLLTQEQRKKIWKDHSVFGSCVHMLDTENGVRSHLHWNILLFHMRCISSFYMELNIRIAHVPCTN